MKSGIRTVIISAILALATWLPMTVLQGCSGEAKPQDENLPSEEEVLQMIEAADTLPPKMTFGAPNNGVQRKYHTLSEVPWGKAPWEMEWKLKFEGVEFLCPLNDFVDSLIARGYELRDKDKRYAILAGTYDGKYIDSRVIAYNKMSRPSAGVTDRAYLTEVYPKAVDTWDEAKQMYETFKQEIGFDGVEMVPMAAIENTNISHVKEGKNYYKNLHKQFKNENAIYETYFSVPEGFMSVEIIPWIMNPKGKWVWEHGKYQIKVTFRNHVPEDSL